MLTGNKNIDFSILMQLDDKELGVVCKTNKKVREICKDEMFWSNRIVKKLNVDPEILYNLKEFLLFETYLLK
jgi:hypothetical protein